MTPDSPESDQVDVELETFTWRGRSHWVGQEPSDEIATSAAEAASNLDKWYDAGKPFFTKELLHKVHEQLRKSPRNGQKISITGLDGAIIDFEVETANSYDGTKPDLEYYIQAPFIQYFTIDHLKDALKYDDLYLAYCNLRITHWAVLRDKHTKKPLHLPYSNNTESLNRLSKSSILAWEGSEAWKKVRTTLMSANIADGIQKIIGLAGGSMSLGEQSELSQRSASQHALLLTVRSLLQGKDERAGKDKISCYAQDPIYTTMDKSILSESKIQVLDDPQAFLEIDDSSVVLSFAPDVPVKQMVADIARPALLIWDRVIDCEEEDSFQGWAMTDPDSSRVKEMIHNYYDEFEFPSHDHFPEMAIYVRRSDIT